MQILISDIHTSVSYDNIRKHFSEYGEIKSLRFKGKFGFLEYQDATVAAEVISKEHVVDGKKVLVSANSRSPDSGRGPSDGIRGGFRDRRPVVPRYKEGCRYCDKCPVHGSAADWPGTGDGLPRFRVVIDNLPENCGKRDIYEFTRVYRVNPSFVRITEVGNHAILEFGSFYEQDKALSALKGRQLLGKDVIVRPYFFNHDDRKGGDSQSKDSNDKLYGDIDEEQELAGKNSINKN